MTQILYWQNTYSPYKLLFTYLHCLFTHLTYTTYNYDMTLTNYAIKEVIKFSITLNFDNFIFFILICFVRKRIIKLLLLLFLYTCIHNNYRSTTVAPKQQMAKNKKTKTKQSKRVSFKNCTVWEKGEKFYRRMSILCSTGPDIILRIRIKSRNFYEEVDGPRKVLAQTNVKKFHC